MEGDELNNDNFSSFSIEQLDSQIENLISEEILPRKKLKVRKKVKKTIKAGSSSRITEDHYRLKVKYDGCFKVINNGVKKKYYFGRQKTIYVDHSSYGYVELLEEMSALYPWDENLNLSLYFLDKDAHSQSFIEVKDDNTYQMMMTMYEEKKEVVVYVTNEQIMVEENRGFDGYNNLSQNLEDVEVISYEDDSDYCHSEQSYHSRHSDFEEDGVDKDDFVDEGEFYSYDKDDPKMEIGATFSHVIAFRRALNHYAVINDFEYNLVKSEPARVTATCANLKCSWRIHASVDKDKVTFIVRTIQPNHSCCGINKRGNKHATQGWISDRIINDVRKDIDISPNTLKKNLEAKYGIMLPYDRVWEGKELALQEIHGKWANSFIHIAALKEEIMKTNSGSIVDYGKNVLSCMVCQ